MTHPEQYWVAPEGETVLVYSPDCIAFIDGDHAAEFVRLLKPGKRESKT